MVKIKKILAITLSCLFILGSFTVIPISAATVENNKSFSQNINVDGTTISKGDTITYSVYMETASTVAGVLLNITYDNTLLQLADTKTINTIENVMPNCKTGTPMGNFSKNNKIILSASNPNGYNFSQPKTVLAQIQFTVIATKGSCVLNYELRECYDTNDVDVIPTLTDKLKINGTEPTIPTEPTTATEPTIPTEPTTATEPTTSTEPTIPTEPSSVKAKLTVNISGGSSFTISINGEAPVTQGTAYTNTNVIVGSTVQLVANNEVGAAFYCWKDKFDRIVSYEKQYSFNFGSNTELTAVYNVPVKNKNSVIFINNKLNQIVEQQLYSATDNIVMPLDPLFVYGYSFTGWDKSADNIKAELAQGKDVMVTAQFTKQTKTYNVQVVGGTATGTVIGGKFEAGTLVKVTADTAVKGKKFAYWQDQKGTIKSYSNVYTFFVFEDTTYTAVFVNETQDITKNVLTDISKIEPNVNDGVITFTMDWNVQSNYTVIQTGILIAKNLNVDDTTLVLGGSPDIKIGASKLTQNVGTFIVNLKNILPTDIIKARSYVTYKDIQGNIKTKYGTVYTTKLGN